MKTLRHVLAALFLLTACAAHAAEAPYPVRPIRFLVPFAPGGSVDIVARVIGQKFTEAWGNRCWSRPGPAPAR